MSKHTPLGAIFLIAGGGFFLFSAYQLGEANMIAAQGVPAEARVLSVDEKRGRRGKRTYAPVYSFVDAEGRSFTGQQAVYLRWVEARSGDTVPVVYDPADPRRSVINTFWGRFGYLPATLFSGLFMGIGAALLLSGSRGRGRD